MAKSLEHTNKFQVNFKASRCEPLCSVLTLMDLRVSGTPQWRTVASPDSVGGGAQQNHGVPFRK